VPSRIRLEPVPLAWLGIQALASLLIFGAMIVWDLPAFTHGLGARA